MSLCKKIKKQGDKFFEHKQKSVYSNTEMSLKEGNLLQLK